MKSVKKLNMGEYIPPKNDPTSAQSDTLSKKPKLKLPINRSMGEHNNKNIPSR